MMNIGMFLYHVYDIHLEDIKLMDNKSIVSSTLRKFNKMLKELC